MEKIEIKTKKKEQRIHIFYCDICNKEIMSSEEYDDGYYKDPGFLPDIIVSGAGNKREDYCNTITLCNECKEKKLSQIRTAIKELGYIEKEW